jgi:hypothetical protein
MEDAPRLVARLLATADRADAAKLAEYWRHVAVMVELGRLEGLDATVTEPRG